jgi:hypothetical protein
MSNCSVDQRAPKRQSRSCKRLASLIAVCKSERRKKSNSEALVSQPAVAAGDDCGFSAAARCSGGCVSRRFFVPALKQAIAIYSGERSS